MKFLTFTNCYISEDMSEIRIREPVNGTVVSIIKANPEHIALFFLDRITYGDLKAVAHSVKEIANPLPNDEDYLTSYTRYSNNKEKDIVIELMSNIDEDNFKEDIVDTLYIITPLDNIEFLSSPEVFYETNAKLNSEDETLGRGFIEVMKIKNKIPWIYISAYGTLVVKLKSPVGYYYPYVSNVQALIKSDKVPIIENKSKIYFTIKTPSAMIFLEHFKTIWLKHQL